MWKETNLCALCQNALPALLSDDATKMVDEEGVVSIKFPDNCKYSFLLIEMCYKTISCCSPNCTVSFGKI